MFNWFKNIKPVKAIFITIGLLILSYVFVHLFALLGIFVTVAFPLLWMVFPQFTTCIYCRNTPVGQRCKSCKQVVDCSNNPPKNFRSVIVNTLTILLLTIFSGATVYAEYKILEGYAVFKHEDSSVEFLIPEKKQYKIGEIFPVDLEIDTNNVAVNAVQSDLQFDTQLCEVVKVSLEKSFAQIFIQNEVNNEKGYLRVTGGLPNPGYRGDKGHFATVYFRAKQAGLFEVAFLPTSLVLANDGSGSNILKNYPVITFLIKPEYISDTEKEIQDVIYSSNVLGVTSNEDQLLFFGDKDNVVLGVEDHVVDEYAQEEGFSLWRVMLAIDNWIINVFRSVFAIFSK